jgi:hypothetical protein
MDGMKSIDNGTYRLVLEESYPRVVRHEHIVSGASLGGERCAMAPRLYLFRTGDRAVATTDDESVRAVYTLAVTAGRAVYHAAVTWDGHPAAEFDLTIRLEREDATIRLENVVEHGCYRFMTVRLEHILSASTANPGSKLVTCGWQGRVLDPSKCKPQLIDYNYVGFTARQCGAVYRPDFMVTFDLPAFDDVFIQDVWAYTRTGAGEVLASLGAELMHRQRDVKGPYAPVWEPSAERRKETPPLPEPLLCGGGKEVRLHFIPGRTLDWPEAARHFQRVLAAGKQCEPRYNESTICKAQFAGKDSPHYSFVQAEDFLRRVNGITDGLKQVCYFTFWQHRGGDNGWPDLSVVNPAVGDKATLRRIVAEAGRYNAVVSFHCNFDEFDYDNENFDGYYVGRDFAGRLWHSGRWGLAQLFKISVPAYRQELEKAMARTVADYGIRETFHLDTYSGLPYMHDFHPDHPCNATDYTAAKVALLDWIRATYNIDTTSENLTDPFVGHIGHVWALFNWSDGWEGEEKVPFAQFIYHGAISWNSGAAGTGQAVLDSLIQGGGVGYEPPGDPPGTFNWVGLVDALYLVHQPYVALRNRRWTDYRHTGSVRRVDYEGVDSYIEVDDAQKTYRVVVDGKQVAENFHTVFPGRKTGSYLAFSLTDRELDWPAPEGWADGEVSALALTDTGPGLRRPARIVNGRLVMKLHAHEPVRLERA